VQREVTAAEAAVRSQNGTPHPSSRWRGLLPVRNTRAHTYSNISVHSVDTRHVRTQQWSASHHGTCSCDTLTGLPPNSDGMPSAVCARTRVWCHVWIVAFVIPIRMKRSL
jgi:hypothetical protein